MYEKDRQERDRQQKMTCSKLKLIHLDVVTLLIQARATEAKGPNDSVGLTQRFGDCSEVLATADCATLRTDH